APPTSGDGAIAGPLRAQALAGARHHHLAAVAGGTVAAPAVARAAGFAVASLDALSHDGSPPGRRIASRYSRDMPPVGHGRGCSSTARPLGVYTKLPRQAAARS